MSAAVAVGVSRFHPSVSELIDAVRPPANEKAFYVDTDTTE